MESEQLEKILKNNLIILGPTKKQEQRGKNLRLYGLISISFGLLLILAGGQIIGIFIIIISFFLILYGKKLRKIKVTGHLDSLNPYDFEILVSDLFNRDGYNCKNLKKSGDQGADILASKNGETYVIQVKRYSVNNKISSGIIRDVYGAMGMYNAGKGIIVTTSYFTNPARKTARKLGIELVDREKLKPLLIKNYYHPYK